MLYPLEPNGAIPIPIYINSSGISIRTRLARPDICHDGRRMMAGYRLGSCCVSLRCLVCLPSITLRVLVLHDAMQLLLLPPLLLSSYQHSSAYLLDCHRDILAQAGTFRRTALAKMAPWPWRPCWPPLLRAAAVAWSSPAAWGGSLWASARRQLHTCRVADAWFPAQRTWTSRRGPLMSSRCGTPSAGTSGTVSGVHHAENES